MATVTIANLIHRAEYDDDGESNSRLIWQHGTPVCVCGEDVENVVTYQDRTDRRPAVQCLSCGTFYPIQENS